MEKDPNEVYYPGILTYDEEDKLEGLTPDKPEEIDSAEGYRGGQVSLSTFARFRYGEAKLLNGRPPAAGYGRFERRRHRHRNFEEVMNLHIG